MEQIFQGFERLFPIGLVFHRNMFDDLILVYLLSLCARKQCRADVTILAFGTLLCAHRCRFVVVSGPCCVSDLFWDRAVAVLRGNGCGGGPKCRAHAPVPCSRL